MNKKLKNLKFNFTNNRIILYLNEKMFLRIRLFYIIFILHSITQTADT